MPFACPRRHRLLAVAPALVSALSLGICSAWAQNPPEGVQRFRVNPPVEFTLPSTNHAVIIKGQNASGSVIVNIVDYANTAYSRGGIISGGAYSLLPLPNGYRYSELYGINAAGDVVGIVWNTDYRSWTNETTPPWRAYIWRTGGGTNGFITTPANSNQYFHYVHFLPRAINDTAIVGEVFAHYFFSFNNYNYASWRDPMKLDFGVATTLSYPDYQSARAVAVNKSGVIAGEAYNADYDDYFNYNYANLFPNRAFGYKAGVWDGNTFVPLGSLPGYAHSAPIAINDAGQILGKAFNQASPLQFDYGWNQPGRDSVLRPFTDNRAAFLWTNGAMTALTAPGAGEARPIGLDKKGQVLLSKDAAYKTFLWQSPTVQADLLSVYNEWGTRFDGVGGVYPERSFMGEDGKIYWAATGASTNSWSIRSMTPVDKAHYSPGFITLSPQSTTRANTGVLITVNGSGSAYNQVSFYPDSFVTFDGAARPTTFVSSTQLTAQLTTADRNALGNHAIRVVNPASTTTPNPSTGQLDGGTSNSSTFTVNEKTARIFSATPNHSPVVAGGVIVTLSGENFIPGKTRFSNVVYASNTANLLDGIRASIFVDPTILSVTENEAQIIVPKSVLSHMYSYASDSITRQAFLTAYNPEQVYVENWQHANGVTFNVDVTPIVVSELGTRNVTTSTAIVTWTTNIEASSKIEYGTTNGYGTTLVADQAPNSYRMGHQIALTSLKPGTLYYYRVTSDDVPHGQTATATSTFATAPEAKPNVAVSGVNLSRSGDIQASVTLTNSGGATATNVQITSATLAGVTATGALPTVGTIVAGGTANATVTFAARPAGNTTLRLSGTYDGGSFSISVRVRVP